MQQLLVVSPLIWLMFLFPSHWTLNRVFDPGCDHSGHTLDFHCGRLRVQGAIFMIYWIEGNILQETSVFTPNLCGFYEFALQAFLRMILVGWYVYTILCMSCKHLPTCWLEVMAMRSLIRIWTVMTGTAIHEGTAWATWWQCLQRQDF